MNKTYYLSRIIVVISFLMVFTSISFVLNLMVVEKYYIEPYSEYQNPEISKKDILLYCSYFKFIIIALDVICLAFIVLICSKYHRKVK